MLGFRLPFARRKGYGMGAAGGGNEGVASVAPSGLLTSLISYWPLDEASGTRYDSVTTSANDLTDNNTVTYAAGVQGNAGQFTRSNSESLSHIDNASLSTVDEDYTFAAWVYLDSLSGTNEQNIVTQFTAASQGPRLIYDFLATRFLFIVGGGGGSSVGTATANSLGAPTTGTWYFIVGWHDSVANTANIQVNNGTVDSVATTGAAGDSSGTFYIGRRDIAGSPFYWNGRIDEVGFWKRVLTATERTNLYNGGAGTTYPFTGIP